VIHNICDRIKNNTMVKLCQLTIVIVKTNPIVTITSQCCVVYLFRVYLPYILWYIKQYRYSLARKNTIPTYRYWALFKYYYPARVLQGNPFECKNYTSSFFEILKEKKFYNIVLRWILYYYTYFYRHTPRNAWTEISVFSITSNDNIRL